MGSPILLIVNLSDGPDAEDAALHAARSSSTRVVALLLLNSHLYHYGHNDVIVPGYARTQFLLHIQEEVSRCASERIAALKKKASDKGIILEVVCLESEDPLPLALGYAKKGYERIFICKERKKWFPLFRKTLEQCLKKEALSPVVAC